MQCNTAANTRQSAEMLLARPPARSAIARNINKQSIRDPPTQSGGYTSAGKRPKEIALKQLNKPATLPRKELDRLKHAAVIITTDDKIEAEMQREIVIRDIEREAERQKQLFKQIDEAKLRDRDVKEKEDIFGEDKVKVLEESFIAKQEQEEEVKYVNRIMLNAKCHAVRDAQIVEKIELAKELKREEARLAKIMIERAKASLREEDEQVKREVEKKNKYASEIKSQLMERENRRFLEAEVVEEEAKVLALANEAVKNDEMRRTRLIRERRDQLRGELNRICEMQNMFKKMLFEQEREGDMRIQAYMRAKEQRERTLAIEKKLAKQAFERKQQLLFDLQSKMLESKTKREEMALTRQQENIEREYRRREKEAVIRKKELEKALHEARLSQLHEAKLREALQLATNENDFQKIVENLRKEEVKQAKRQEERLKNRDRYRDDIIRQMNDKESMRRVLHERDQREAFEWREQEKQRERNIKSVIQAKLASMRDANLPDMYIKDVERQLKKISEQK